MTEKATPSRPRKAKSSRAKAKLNEQPEQAEQPQAAEVEQPDEQLPTRHGRILYKENPFVVDLKTRTKRTVNKRGDMALVNNQTGEVHAQIAGFWEGHVVDATKFVKLFIKGVTALKELTGAGTKVFEVLYRNVQAQANKDVIYMSFNMVDQALTPMSEATYARGMRELVAKKFLAASPNIGLYWLNPSFIWNGDRIAFLQEYVREGSNEKLNPPQLQPDQLRDQPEQLQIEGIKNVTATI